MNFHEISQDVNATPNIIPLCIFHLKNINLSSVQIQKEIPGVAWLYFIIKRGLIKSCHLKRI